MGDTIQSIARRQRKKTENRHFDLPASSFWKGLPGKKSTYQMRERAQGKCLGITGIVLIVFDWVTCLS